MSETKEFSLPSDGNSSPPELLSFTRNTNRRSLLAEKDKKGTKANALVPFKKMKRKEEDKTNCFV